MSLDQMEPNKGQIPGVPKNPRFIRDEKYRKLKESLQDDPEMQPLREILVFLFNGKYVIIGGNMRYRALKELGEKTAFIKRIPPDTPVEKLRAITLKDNSSFGEFDFDELANNWDQSLIDAAGIDIPAVEEEEDEEEAQDDDFDVEGNIPKKPISKMGDLYILGNHRLICGDATKQEYYEALFGNSKTADLIVTDPPYNVDYQGGTKDKLKIQNDSMSDSQFYNFLLDAFTQMAQFTKAGGSFYIWHSDKERMNFNKAAVASGLLPHQTLIWNKNSFVLGRQDYQWRHEPCLYGWKEGAAHYFTKNRALSTVIDEIENFDINKATKDELKTMLEKIMDRDIPTTVIDENKPLRSEDHPTMKPIPLLARGIKNSSKPNEIILDPFGGSGSTMIAAEQLNRRCFMMELDGRYVDVIVKRWEELTGNTAQLVGNLLEQSGTAENSPKNS